MSIITFDQIDFNKVLWFISNENKNKTTIQINLNDVKEFIHNLDNNYTCLYKDYEFEEEHSISIQICELREIFNNMKSLYNEVYLNKLNQGPINGNKTAYIKLCANWNHNLKILLEKTKNSLFPISIFEEMMWYHVIGCPETIRTKDDLNYIISQILEKFIKEETSLKNSYNSEKIISNEDYLILDLIKLINFFQYEGFNLIISTMISQEFVKSLTGHGFGFNRFIDDISKF